MSTLLSTPLVLSLGVQTYVLPESNGQFAGVSYNGFKLHPKTDETDDWEWDYEVENDTIKFNRVFISLLDWEGDNVVKLNFSFERG